MNDFYKWGEVLLKFLNFIDTLVLDSERSDKCIDSTILCVFFCVYLHHNLSK